MPRRPPSDLLPQGIRPASDRPQNGAAHVGRQAERKKAANTLVHEMLARIHSRRAIARHLGWDLNTALRYANVAHWQDTVRENRPPPSRLDPYKAPAPIRLRPPTKGGRRGGTLGRDTVAEPRRPHGGSEGLSR